MIQKFIPNKNYSHLRKKNLSREAMQMIRNKQRLWKAYKRTGKFEDYTKNKDALKETTNEIRESKRNFERKLAANKTVRVSLRTSEVNKRSETW